jgi:hypothetical protein
VLWSNWPIEIELRKLASPDCSGALGDVTERPLSRVRKFRLESPAELAGSAKR